MKKLLRYIPLSICIIGLVWLLYSYLHTHNIAVLNPKGIIADKQRNLIVLSSLLMLLVIIPVYILTAVFAWRYRATNKNAHYTPNWDHNPVFEVVWWAIPSTIILSLAIIAWISTHQLDPFKPLDSPTKPLTIQVVALEWKWLFIYPEQNIASVNYVQFPKDTPITFEITSDAPMNSFWIPQLGGQIYAMSGMVTQLHLQANAEGKFAGSSANLSGAGFAGMKFTAEAVSEDAFQKWVQTVKYTPTRLDLQEYKKLSQPSQNNPVAYYSSTEKDLQSTIVMKYMMPPMEGMDHGK